MKKLSLSFVSILLMFCLIVPIFSTISARADGREITVYSVEDYIDPSLLENFENEMGIKVNYYTFASNEEIYNELNKNKNNVNLMCVSEYMIMKMREEKLIKTFEVPEVYGEYLSQYIKTIFESLDMYAVDGKTYTAGYMWGTMGFVYNMNKYSEADLQNWNSILDDRFYDRVTIKDSIRDTYIMSVGAVYKDELLKEKKAYEEGEISFETYNQKITEVFNRTDENTVSKVEKFLQDAKQNLYCFEVDSAKQDIIRQRIDVYFAWSGDAVYAISEGQEANVPLGYVIPEEGSNIWFDGLVMTSGTNGQKEEDCKTFIDYVSTPSNVQTNMDYIGYSSVIAGEEVYDYVCDTYSVDEGDIDVDLSYFFRTSEEDTNEYIITTDEENYQMLFAQYPDEETIGRCVVMRNFSNEELTRINAMWNRIKLITLTNVQIGIIIAIFAIFIIILICIMNRERLYKFVVNIKSKRKSKPRKNGYKIIKVEKI